MKTDDAKTAQILRCDLRALVRRDLPRAAEIEAASFGRPWDEDDLRALLWDRDAHGYAAWAGQSIAGTMIRRREDDCVRVVRLAVAPAYRRLGVGSFLLARAVADAARLSRDVACLSVPETGLGAQLWLRHNGWRAVACRRGAFGRGEDGIDFQFRVERW